MKKSIIAILLASLCASGFATEITVKVTPAAIFPFLSAGEQKFEPAGFGTFVDTGINFLDLINVGPEIGLMVLSKQNAARLPEGSTGEVLVVPVGLQAGIYTYPFSRLEAGVGVVVGAYGSTTNNRTHYAPFYRAYGDVSFRLNTKVSLGLNASWINCQNNTWFGNPGIAGVSAGVSVKIKLDTEKVSGNVDSSVDCEESIFPLLYSIYKDNPIGTLTIENNESAEIRNVTVKFRAEGYTASEFECGKIRMIRKHRTETIMLCADFNEKILRFSEAGKISGEVVINYDILGDKRTAVIPVTLSVYNRNTVRWMDPAMISSFVSAKAQEVFELSKSFVGIARKYARSGINQNLQYSMYVFEGIRCTGITLQESADTPYRALHLNPDQLDYVQYPYQTLSYRSGDMDDLGILYMSMLESVGIGAAYIPLENDFIVAINIGDDTTSIRNMFNGDSRILSVDDQIWLPVSMSSLSQGFIKSWANGVAKVQAAINADEDIDFIVLSDAWQVYPPSGFSSGESTTKVPAEKTVYTAGENAVVQYINQEFGPQIAEVQARIKKEGVSAALYNQLGMLYVRAGMYTNAMQVYEVSANLGSIPAMNNLGNICTLQKNYKEAKRWYEKVLSIEPNNETARKNLERIITELDY